jgi:hypothetical protein
MEHASGEQEEDKGEEPNPAMKVVSCSITPQSTYCISIERGLCGKGRKPSAKLPGDSPIEDGLGEGAEGTERTTDHDEHRNLNAARGVSKHETEARSDSVRRTTAQDEVCSTLSAKPNSVKTLPRTA